LLDARSAAGAGRARSVGRHPKIRRSYDSATASHE
jgi:hypothetical protein